jgi:rsbT co-antagonist protein RsbR
MLADFEAENARLVARVKELEARPRAEEQEYRAQIARLAELAEEVEMKSHMFQATLNAIADGVMVMNHEGVPIHLNPAAEKILDLGSRDRTSEEMAVRYSVFHADGVTPCLPESQPHARALRGETVDNIELIIRYDDHPEGVWVAATARPILSKENVQVGMVAVMRDIGERKRWEAELKRQLISEMERNEALQQLQLTVQELSTPILELWDDVLALPVIGIVDSRRSADMMERLLDEITHKQCRFVIIDITGVEVVDSATADHFIKLVKAVELLGARCILTGARGAVAQTLVSLGVDLGPIVTLRNLKHGLMECLRRMAAEDELGRGTQLFQARQGGLARSTRR